MAVSLVMSLAGRAPADATRVLVNGREATLTEGTFQAEVPVTAGVVAVTAINAAGVETSRTVQVLVSTGGIA